MPSQTKPGSAQQPDDKYSATAWGGSYGDDLEMPSGQLAYVKKPGVDKLIEAGVLHSLDSLSGVVEGLIAKGDGKPVAIPESVMKNPSQIDALIHIVDKVVCHVVIKPAVTMKPNDVTSRKNGVVYTDMVSLEDRLFIFQYAVGGTTSIEQFRAESALPLGNLADVAADGGSTK